MKPERKTALIKIAKGVERLKAIAEANDLRVVGYLLDTTLREARDQVAENDGDAPLDEQKPFQLESEAGGEEKIDAEGGGISQR